MKNSLAVLWFTSSFLAVPINGLNALAADETEVVKLAQCVYDNQDKDMIESARETLISGLKGSQAGGGFGLSLGFVFILEDKCGHKLTGPEDPVPLDVFKVYFTRLANELVAKAIETVLVE